MQTLHELSQHTPLRLSARERRLLNILESTLEVSEYTDNVDISLRRNKVKRVLDGILEVCAIGTGLTVCANMDDYEMIKEDELEKKRSKRSFPLSLNGFRAKSRVASAAVQQNGDENNGFETETVNLAGRDPHDNEIFFQEIFEIGRRNKILNPAKMRSTYGKLMYLLQDSQSSSVAKSLGFSLYKKIEMVGPYLTDMGIDELLSDKRLSVATQHISNFDDKLQQKLSREDIHARVQQKAAATEMLVAEYGKKAASRVYETVSEETLDIFLFDVRRCIDSLADAVTVIESNVAPVKRMLSYLEDNFDPDKPEKLFSLSLSASSKFSSTRYGYGINRFGFGGSSEGPTLNHNHPTQYTFVWQSLRLWCKVQQNMHKLWVCADDDLLSTSSSYQLSNTGQGMNRVQHCPGVRKVMSSLLSETQKEAGQPWVGLSVIHLGDRDVPNALVFIDKYTQIPRFLQPIVSFIDSIPELYHDEHVAGYIKNEFGGERNLKMTILSDYFKHGFDGSGDDGGSCIDGRLTSSWNWTSRVHKKPYYHALMMTGFQGFDGEFK